MIPVSLTIKGLYSYQEEQLIDFTKLTEAQLFGIFGTVGSGKSSILEAISFALYSDTERLNKSGDNRNYNMLNLKSSELLIDFTFLNHDEQLYRFVVKGRRNGNNFEDVGTFKRSAYKLNGAVPEPLPETTAEAIIGLSYENFRRTIIIPQGKFQEFLQLGDAARTNMLKEIFQLEKYEFYQQTVSLERKNEAELQQLSGSLLQLEHVSEEIITIKTEEVNRLAEKHKEAQTTLTELEKEEAELTGLKKQLDERTQKQLELNQLNLQKPSIDEWSKQVNQVEYCLQHFKGLFEQEENAKRIRQSKQKDGDAANGKLERINTQLEVDEPQLEVVAKEYAQLDVRRKEKQDYSTLLLVKKATITIQQLNQGLKDKTEINAKSQETKTNAEQLLTNQKRLITELKAKMPDSLELGNVQSWFVQLDALTNNLAGAKNSVSGLEQQIEAQKHQIPSLIPPILLERFPFSVDSTIENHLLTFQNEERSNRNREKELKQTLDKLRLQSELAVFTEQIAENEACPLCGSHEHPQVLHIENVTSDVEKTEKDLNLLEEEYQRITEASRHLEIAASRITDSKDQLQVFKTKVTEIEEQILQHRSTFVSRHFSPDERDHFRQLQQESVTNQQELKRLETDLGTLEESLRLATLSYETTKDELSELHTQIKVETSNQSMLKGQIQILEETALVLDEVTIQEKIDDLNLFILEIEKKHLLLTNRIQQNKVDKASSTATYNAGKEEITRLDKELSELTKRIEITLSDSSLFSHRTEVEKTLTLDIDLPIVKQQIAYFQQQLFSVNATLEVLNKALDGKTVDPDKYANLLRSVQQFKTDVDGQNTARIEAETLLNKLKEEWIVKKQVISDTEKREHRKTNIQTLKRLFSASGFVNYISSVYLQQLCEASNERFYKLTKQQLRLELTEGNNFQIRDYLNEGRLRSVKTLSGGQTFQASLCLALALAESIPQQSRANQNFFFLDEGFGSQDKESLRIVFESLKALRQENRIVGVISHVEELQQEIDTYLTIANDPEKGSLVMGSWE
jgi:exonuclease SbcC